MRKTTDTNNKSSPKRQAVVSRRDYLRLASAAGVTGVGMSALGRRVRAADHQPKRVLTIEATGPTANYNFAVDGSVTHSEAMGATVGGDDISGNEVHGHVAGSGRDSWAFTGELQRFSVDNEVLFYLNGEPLTDIVTIEDINEGRTTNYELRVDGEVLKSTAMSATIDASDEITPRDDPSAIEPNLLSGEPLAGETFVFGGVYGGTDSYAISGKPTGFVADGNVKVFLNGERVTPGNFRRNTLTFEGTGTYADYEFSVSGDLTKSTWMNATISDEDNVSGGSATGAVTNGRDSYAFTGEITDFRADDSLIVYLNSERIDADDLGREPRFENTLSIDGIDGRTDYRFGVEGTLEENYGLTSEDSIEGKTATGAVGSGTDSYTFSGDVSMFDADTTGSFRTILNGEEVDPETLAATQTTPDAEDLPNGVSIRALTNARTEYGFGVTGVVATGDRANTWSGDNSSYEYARGWIAGGGLDSYRFAGEIATFTDFDSIQIDINHEKEHIVISNTGKYEQTGYEISVSGDLEAYQTNSNDSVDGGTAVGQVNKGTDVYGFTGAVEKIVIDEAFEAEITRYPVLAEGTLAWEYEFTPDTIVAEEYYISEDLANQYGERRILFDRYEFDRSEDVEPELNEEFPENADITETEPLKKLVGTEYEWNRYYEQQGAPATPSGGEPTAEGEVSIAATKSDYKGPRWQYKGSRKPLKLFRRVYTISAPINVVWNSENRSFSDIVNNMKGRRWRSNGIVGNTECSSARYIRVNGNYRTADANLGTKGGFPNCLRGRDHVRMWKDTKGTFGGRNGTFKIGSAHKEPTGHILCAVIDGRRIGQPIQSEPAENALRKEWKNNTSASVSSINLRNSRKGTKCVKGNDKYSAYIKWKPP